MKVDGITLLRMIRAGKIKDKTEIKIYYYNVPTRNILIYSKGELGWKPGEFLVGDLCKDEYTFAFEIIEEDKEIEELFIKLDEFEDSYYDTTLLALAEQQEKIRRAVNYLLKKESK